MGEGMEMKRTLYIFLCCFTLSCSFNNSNEESPLKKILDLYLQKDEDLQIKTFSFEDIKNINYPLIEVKTNGLLVQALMLPLSTRNEIKNYISGSGQGLTLDNNIVTKTQGMNTHLISLEYIGFKNFPDLITNENKPLNFMKIYTFVTPMFDTKIYSFDCTFLKISNENLIILSEEVETTFFQEKCFNNKLAFENSYWVDHNGIIRKSKQWISPKNIFADILFLKLE